MEKQHKRSNIYVVIIFKKWVREKDTEEKCNMHVLSFERKSFCILLVYCY